jgi:hypothetical protein
MSRWSWLSKSWRGAATRVGWPDQGGVGVEEDLTTNIAVAIWRAHNNNLILRRGRCSDVDGRQGNAIPISD